MSAAVRSTALKVCNCVYVSNLPYEAAENTVREAFEEHQIAVSSVQFLKKGSLNRTRNSGLACVTVSNADDVEASCRALDSELVHGRPMIVRKDKFVQDQSGYSPGTAAEVRLSCSGQPAKQ